MAKDDGRETEMTTSEFEARVEAIYEDLKLRDRVSPGRTPWQTLRKRAEEIALTEKEEKTTMASETTREQIAAEAYLRAYGAHEGATEEEKAWGLRAEAADALAAVVAALGLSDRIDARDGSHGLADALWEFECEGLEAEPIMHRFLPLLDEHLALA